MAIRLHPSPETLRRVADVARGAAEADVVLTGGALLNVFTEEVQDGWGLAIAGGLLAFLWYNRHPARVFMGDAGSLGLGYALAAMAIQQGFLLLLPLLGLVFVIEALSVMMQVAYFKATGGRRIFKMTPIHLTFQLEGWSENRIDAVFWTVGAVAALASAAAARL